MNPKFRKIEPAFWTDEKMSLQEPDVKYLALYLLSSPHSNAAGCYYLPPGYACADLGWTIEQFTQAIKKLEDIGFALYDVQARVVFLPNYLRHNRPENPKSLQTIQNALAFLPHCELTEQAIATIQELYPNFFRTTSELKPNQNRTETEQLPNQTPHEKEIEKEIEIENEKDKKHMCVSTKEDKKSFTYSEDFENFWSIYPRRIEKRRAYRAWQARLKEGILSGLLITCAQNYEKYVRLRGTEERYIKHPATFLGPDHPYEDWKEPPPDSPIPKMGNVAAGLMRWADEHEKEEKRE